jgi:hypothetical protein
MLEKIGVGLILWMILAAAVAWACCRWRHQLDGDDPS